VDCCVLQESTLFAAFARYKSSQGSNDDAQKIKRRSLGFNACGLM